MIRRYFLLPIVFAGAALAIPALGAAEAEAVAGQVEAFRLAQIAGTENSLSALIAPELSYSHSDGRVEDRAKFLANATSGKSSFVSLEYRDPAISIVGNVAVVRFHWVGEQQVFVDGKRVGTNLHILMVWDKRNDGWKLLARSATKL